MQLKRWLKGLGIGAVAALLGTVLSFTGVGYQFERNVGLEWLFDIRGPLQTPDEVLVVGINENTGADLGLPALPRDWPRSIHAKLIDQLVVLGAEVIVFDVYFGTAKDPEEDAAFSSAVARSGRVVLFEKLTGKSQPVKDAEGRTIRLVWSESLVPPLDALADSAAGLGIFPLPKIDASVYQFWTFKDSVSNEPSMPSVALQQFYRSQFADWRAALLDVGFSPAENLDVDPSELANAGVVRQLMRAQRSWFTSRAQENSVAALPTAFAQLVDLYSGPEHRYLNFYGPPGSVTNVPYQSVIAGYDPDHGELDFSGKVAFVGYSDLYDPGQPDRFHTVFTRADGVDLAGVEIAATAFANLLHGQSLRIAGAWTTVGLLVGIGLVFGLVFYLLPAQWSLPLLVVLGVGYGLLAQDIFASQHLWLPLAVPLLVQVPLALVLGLLGQYLFERERGQRISDAINYYLPENIAADLAAGTMEASDANKVVYSTCLATDMAGFSGIAENMPPGELADFLNDYFESLSGPLKKYGVNVTEFRADAIMCAWTSEEESVDIRQRALKAALEADAAVADFRVRRDMADAPLRIGLEAGWVYVGHAGGGGHFVYSIVGDSANTASRLESLNKHLGTSILASAEVVAGLGDIPLRPLGKFLVKGKSDPLELVEVINSGFDAPALAEFAEALKLFHAGNWSEAHDAFAEAGRKPLNRGPAHFFMRRAQLHMQGVDVPEAPDIVAMDSK